MKKSSYFSLNWQDLIKGLVVAVLSAVLPALLGLVQDGTLPTGDEWRSLAGISLAAFLAYLIKNIVTNNEGDLLKKDTVLSTEKKKEFYTKTKKHREVQ